jgi:AraC-like DNA-binding protein
MTKNLQKTANLYNEVTCPYEGILDPQQFARTIQMRRYKPSLDLSPFVAHYFVAHFHVSGDAAYIATDVLSHPVVHMLFTPESSWVMGVTTGKRTLKLKGAGVYAGVRFKPGGFYPFWAGRMAELVEKTIPMTQLFPVADEAFTRSLLALAEDHDIVERLEAFLCHSHPRNNRNIELVNKVIAAIEADHHIHTTQAVAQAFNISERSLQHLFKTYVGLGVKWVIMRIRFLEAMRHAHNSQKPNWTAIAAELGYSTQSHFINDFKKLMGQSPSKYAKTIAEAGPQEYETRANPSRWPHQSGAILIAGEGDSN